MKELIILIGILLIGCTEAEKRFQEKETFYDIGEGANPLKIYVIDSCEYIAKLTGYNSDVITHKGNCKFCAKRK